MNPLIKQNFLPIFSLGLFLGYLSEFLWGFGLPINSTKDSSGVFPETHPRHPFRLLPGMSATILPEVFQ